jgi:hypothetical protein
MHRGAIVPFYLHSVPTRPVISMTRFWNKPSYQTLIIAISPHSCRYADVFRRTRFIGWLVHTVSCFHWPMTYNGFSPCPPEPGTSNTYNMHCKMVPKQKYPWCPKLKVYSQSLTWRQPRAERCLVRRSTSHMSWQQHWASPRCHPRL